MLILAVGRKQRMDSAAPGAGLISFLPGDMGIDAPAQRVERGRPRPARLSSTLDALV